MYEVKKIQNSRYLITYNKTFLFIHHIVEKVL